MKIDTWECGLIEDGFVQDGYIAAVDGLYPALAYQFVPALPLEAEATIASNNGAQDGCTALKVMIDEISKRVRKWSFGPEITPERVARMRRQQLMKLYRQVIGEQPMDTSPAKATDIGQLTSKTEDLVQRLGKLPGSTE